MFYYRLFLKWYKIYIYFISKSIIIYIELYSICNSRALSRSILGYGWPCWSGTERACWQWVDGDSIQVWCRNILACRLILWSFGSVVMCMSSYLHYYTILVINLLNNSNLVIKLNAISYYSLLNSFISYNFPYSIYQLYFI